MKNTIQRFLAFVSLGFALGFSNLPGMAQGQENPDKSKPEEQIVTPPVFIDHDGREIRHPWTGVKASERVTKHQLDENLPVFQVVEKGPNHRMWAKVVTEKIAPDLPEEREVLKSYVELEGGLHYWDEDTQTYKDSIAIIEPHPQGAVALNGPQKVIFTGNLNKRGAVDILGPDGVRLQASILGLTYYDEANGDEVIIATLKNSQGEIIGDNRLIYRDAFDNIAADIVYTYRKSGLEQDIILREAPPAPSVFGLSNDSTRLESITEWYDTPQPERKIRVIPKISNNQDVQTQDLVDEELSFGAIKIIRGRAFWYDADPDGEGTQGNPNGLDDLPVMKKWRINQGRSVLYESIEYKSVQDELNKLPLGIKFQANRVKKYDGDKTIAQSPRRYFPNNVFDTSDSLQEVMMASIDELDEQGFVIDYTTVVSGSDYVFEADRTYYISGNIVLTGNTTIQGGAIIKFADGSGASIASIRCQGTVDFQTAMYRPAILTSVNDNYVGETITGSNGNPIGNRYADYGLWLQPGGQAVEAHHLIIKFAQIGIYFDNAPGSKLRHVQFLDCQIPVATIYSDLTVHNVLIDGFDTYALWASGNSGGPVVNISGEHLTVRDGPNLAYNYYWNGVDGKTYLTNSLVVDVPGTVGLDATSTTVTTQGYNVFQFGGAGYSYLKVSSPYRDAGTENIDPQLRNELFELTTTAPNLVSSQSGPTTWKKVIPRDLGVPDLGYHYAAIDYNISQVFLYNDLNIEPGTSIAFYGGYGLYVYSPINVKISGTSDNPVNITRYNSIQEQHYNWGYSTGSDGTFISCYAKDSFIKMNFTNINGRGNNFYGVWLGSGSYNTDAFRSNNTVYYSGRNYFSGEEDTTININNSLFIEGFPQFASRTNLELYNNTFLGNSTASFSLTYPGNWVIKDNLFHEVALSIAVGSPIPYNHGWNGYYNTQSQTRFNPSHSDDVFITNGTSFTFQTGPLGKYYHPSSSPFLDQGSRNADVAGLFHHTVREDQAKEKSSVVDMGYHYASANVFGEPLDADMDGLPDVDEDSDGNGYYGPSVDAGNWKIADELGDWSQSTSSYGAYLVYPAKSSKLP